MMHEDLTKGIVQILRRDGVVVGTGFIISKNLIATCTHVIQAAGKSLGHKVSVRFYQNGKELTATVIRGGSYSPDKVDISILQLENELPSDVNVLSLGSSAGTTGHKVSTFGFSAVGEVKGIWGHGDVLGKVIEGEASLLQIDSNEITAGFSGAPLWSESRHRVIGVVVSIAKKDQFNKLQNVAFAIPSEILQSICPELKVKDICPYRGLSPFKEDDKHLFFGREKIILELSKQLRNNPLFLAVVGPSGSGKSSLVFAGLLPHIRKGDIIGFENAKVVTFRPNDISKSDNVCDSDPEESLIQALSKSEISVEKDGAWENIRTYLEKNPEIRLVVYADQFETLFANVDKDKQKEFIQRICGLLKSGLKISFLLTIRGDYYNFLLNSMLEEFLSEGQVNVRSMSEEEMREAIKNPADRTCFEIEPGLENLIITDLKNTENPLPLLEFTLTQLWNHKSNGMLTHEGYIRIGRASGAIGQWGNETYNSLSTEEKEFARKIFTRLIHYGKEGLPDSRRRLPLSGLTGNKQVTRQLVKKLADAHLLVTDCEFSKKAQTVEIIHDSLLTEWIQLKKWIVEKRSFLTWRQRLEDKLDEWNRNRKDEGNLLRGAPLIEAKGWIKKHEEELNEDEIKYIKESSELEEKEKAEEERIRNEKLRTKNVMIMGLTFFITVMTILAVMLLLQSHVSNKNAEEASALDLASKSEILHENPKNIDKSVLCAIDSFQILSKSTNDNSIIAEIYSKLNTNSLFTKFFSKPEAGTSIYLADKSIRRAFLFIPDKVVALNYTGQITKIVFSPDSRYVATVSNVSVAVWNASTGKGPLKDLKCDGKVLAIKFSPNGKYIAAASGDKKARVWDWNETGKNVTLNHSGSVLDITFSPNGKYIATASSDNTARLWDWNETGKNVSLNHNGPVSKIKFSSNGNYIATTTGNNVSIWNMDALDKIFTLNHSQNFSDNISNNFSDKVLDITFSLDGEKIAVASGDEAYLWDWNRTDKTPIFMNHVDEVRNVAFSPNGKFIATASKDRTACIWDVTTGSNISLKHDYALTNISFSPDGKYITTSSEDETARLWDVAKGRQISVMNHDSGVNDVVFSPDGKHIATASNNKSYIWDPSAEFPVLNHDDSVIAVAFSPDGKYVATASRDKTALLWDAFTGKQLDVMKHNGSLNNVTFSPDGKYIGTASDDGTACVWSWNKTNGNITLIHNLKHSGKVLDIKFSPNNKHIVTSSGNNASVWDTLSGEKPIKDLKCDGKVRDVTFSPDGKYIATASEDNKGRIWDWNGKNANIPLNHKGWVNRIVFSPDGKYIATASFDNTTRIWKVRIWDAVKGEDSLSTLNFTRKVYDIAFSQDGSLVATACWDKNVSIWNWNNAKVGHIPLNNLTHDDYMFKVVFSPDGKYIATTNGRTALVWDVYTGEKIAAIAHDGVVNDVRFSPDGKYIATASDDKTARLYLFNTTDLINKASHCLTLNLTQGMEGVYG